MPKKDNYTNLKLIMKPDFAGKKTKDMIIFFREIFANIKNQDDFIEVFYAMCEAGPTKFRVLAKEFKETLAGYLQKMSLDRIKMMLLYISGVHPECFRIVLEYFRVFFHDAFMSGHFNEIIILILNMSILNEDSAIVFIETMGDTIRRLALTEGFKHFGTVLWYITIMKKPRVAKKLLLVLLDIISRKASCLTDLADMLFWLVKGDEDLGIYAANLLKDRMLSLMKKASVHDIVGFLIITSKHKKLFEEVWRHIHIMFLQIIENKDFRDRLQTLLNALRVSIPLPQVV